MENTENIDRKGAVYLLSFGDSRRYRYIVREREGLEKLVKYEKRLNDFLRERFPGESFTYYTTPRLVKVDEKNGEDYRAYEEFDGSHLDDICEELLREVKVMHSNEELNSNDAWGA